MMEQEVSLELMVGRSVLTLDGRRLGRIEEIRANDRAEITVYLVGKGALAERLSALGLISHHTSGYLIRWDQMDVSNPLTPKLTCDVTELQRL